MPQYVYRYNNCDEIIDIAPTAAAVTQTSWANLIMPRGVYQYNSTKYNFDTDGLYGIVNIGVDGGYRIIYQNDVYALMSAIAWLCAYGRIDDGATNASLVSKAKTIKLSLRCENTINFARYLLSSVGLTSRICRLLTAETPNNWDDGHVTLEVNIGGEWKYWDLPNNFYPNLATQNLDSYIGNLSADKVMIADGERDLNGAGPYQVHTNTIYDLRLRTPAKLDAWVNRIYQIPGIQHTDGKTYFYMPAGTESRQPWVESLNSLYRVVSYSTWVGMFY